MNFLYRLVASVGSLVLRCITESGRFGRFSWTVIREFPASFRRFSIVVREVLFLGNRSLVIIAVSGFFIGGVLGLQGYDILVTYGSEEALGVLVALALVRELGPVVTALLFAGRAGTSLTAEIGLMRSGEQLSAMEMMGVDPVQRVLAPRFTAAMISLPILTMIFNAVGVIGGWVVGVVLIGSDSGAFWSHMQASVDVFEDIGNSVVKSVVFSAVAGLIALYEGYTARATPEGVSQATTRTVVVSSLMILCFDFIMTALMFAS